PKRGRRSPTKTRSSDSSPMRRRGTSPRRRCTNTNSASTRTVFARVENPHKLFDTQFCRLLARELQFENQAFYHRLLVPRSDSFRVNRIFRSPNFLCLANSKFHHFRSRLKGIVECQEICLILPPSNSVEIG